MAAGPHVFAALQQASSLGATPNGELQVFDRETAREIEAIVCQIIPSTDGPGAREAGVIYFIDRALATFASDEVPKYHAGLFEAEQKRKELFPNSTSIASLESEQQVALIQSIEHSEFFDLLRSHTVFGFLGNPSYGGNRNRIGWTQIGFDARMSYAHPFGYYDAQSLETDK